MIPIRFLTNGWSAAVGGFWERPWAGFWGVRFAHCWDAALLGKSLDIAFDRILALVLHYQHYD